MLYKYDGPAFNGYERRINDNWIAYVKAHSSKQALMLLCMRYKKQFTRCSYVVLKERYLTNEQ